MADRLRFVQVVAALAAIAALHPGAALAQDPPVRYGVPGRGALDSRNFNRPQDIRPYAGDYSTLPPAYFGQPNPATERAMLLTAAGLMIAFGIPFIATGALQLAGAATLAETQLGAALVVGGAAQIAQGTSILVRDSTQRELARVLSVPIPDDASASRAILERDVARSRVRRDGVAIGLMITSSFVGALLVASPWGGSRDARLAAAIGGVAVAAGGLGAGAYMIYGESQEERALRDLDRTVDAVKAE